MLDLKKNKRILLIIFCFFGIFVWVGAYFWCFNSEAYEKASLFIKNNEELQNIIGKPVNTRLGLFNFRVSHGTKYSSAEFTIVASGSKEKTDIYFLLSKNSEQWVIDTAIANINGELVNILVTK